MLWIAGGQLADPTPRPGALCVDGETIAAKAQAAPPGASAIDARGLILVPALIDAHVHLCVAGDPAILSREQARRGLAAVLDLGAPERMLPFRHPPRSTPDPSARRWTRAPMSWHIRPATRCPPISSRA